MFYKICNCSNKKNQAKKKNSRIVHVSVLPVFEVNQLLFVPAEVLKNLFDTILAIFSTDNIWPSFCDFFIVVSIYNFINFAWCHFLSSLFLSISLCCHYSLVLTFSCFILIHICLHLFIKAENYLVFDLFSYIVHTIKS